MARVLLTAGRIPGALELARALAKDGAEVLVADSYPIHLCQASRAVERSFHVPAPKVNFAGYRQAILSIVIREKIDIIIPCSEEVMFLARFRDELEKYCEVFFSELPLLLNLHHKQRFIEWAEAHGLGVPQSVAYRGQALLPAFTARPYIIKKAYSRAGGGVIFAKAGARPQDYGIPQDGSWLVQEKSEGQPVCSVSLIQNGKLVLTELYRPASSIGTISVVFCRVRSAAIEAWIERFATVSGYHGFVSFDFFEGPDGVQAIECNPRMTSGIHLCDPQQLAKAVYQPGPCIARYQLRTRAQVALGVLSALPQLMRQPQLLPRIKDILQARDVIFSWSDPLPAFYQLLCYVYFFRRKFQARIPLAACVMEGVEWDQDMSEMLQALPSSHSVASAL